jgi:hypothetical protein
MMTHMFEPKLGIPTKIVHYFPYGVNPSIPIQNMHKNA